MENSVNGRVIPLASSRQSACFLSARHINSHEWSMVGCSLSLRDYFPFFKKLENILIMWYSDNNTGKQSLSRAVKINVSPFFRECKEDFEFNLKMKFMNLFLVNQGYQINISQRFWEPKMI